MQQRHEVTQRRQRLIANVLTTGMKSQISVTRAVTTVPSSGQQVGDHTLPSLEHCSMQQTSHPAVMVDRCRRNHFNTDGNTKSRSLFFESGHDTGSSPGPSARAEWLLAGIIDSALHHSGHVPPLDGGTGDHDHSDSETDTAIPDDDDDIASPSCL